MTLVGEIRRMKPVLDNEERPDAEATAWALGTVEFTREAIVTFARRYDPQPFHIHEKTAQTTLLNGLAASGWHTCANLMRLLRARLAENTQHCRLLEVEDLRWRLPVRPGDHISGFFRILNSHAACATEVVHDVYCEAWNNNRVPVMTWRAKIATSNGASGNSPQVWPRQRDVIPVAPNHGPHHIKYFEDVNCGDEIDLGSCIITAEEIDQFNLRYYGAGAVRTDTDQPKPQADLWLLASLWMQRLVRYYYAEAQTLRGMGRPVPALGPSPGVRNMQHLRPVHAGDNLRFRSWAQRKVALRSRSEWGLLVGGAEVVDGSGEVALSFLPHLLLQCRGQPERA